MRGRIGNPEIGTARPEKVHPEVRRSAVLWVLLAASTLLAACSLTSAGQQGTAALTVGADGATSNAIASSAEAGRSNASIGASATGAGRSVYLRGARPDGRSLQPLRVEPIYLDQHPRLIDRSHTFRYACLDGLFLVCNCPGRLGPCECQCAFQ